LLVAAVALAAAVAVLAELVAVIMV